MKKALVLVVSVMLMTVALGACQAAPAGPQIEVSGVWGRPSPMTAGNGAAYMLIENTGSEDDKVIGAWSDVAENTEIHDMTMDDGVMKMFHVDSYDVPAGGSVELKPGGKHVMFIGLYDQLEVGQVVTVELEFEKSEKMTVEAEIREE
ncbi:MAG: copper chaperone PCu(A)C [Anaerolineae bacterium]|jgi:periplasmic copper chaperone A|nr:copper chaperone PCu(A)C [Anaerolineae bacterium]MBT7072727.1 copper chaperone PCu(A)C [Anaerolineae bacterium]MBT7324662.1 copper chaperone PCu(A)C [Anaerolineae bacterium]